MSDSSPQKDFVQNSVDLTASQSIGIKSRKNRKIRALNAMPFLSGILLSLALLNLLLVTIVFALYGYFQFTGRILPGVYVEGGAVQFQRRVVVGEGTDQACDTGE